MTTTIKAALDARDVPLELFGTGMAARTRKFVLLNIALWANPDGSHAFPSLHTIARTCGLSVRGVQQAITWLVSHRLLDSGYKASRFKTNNYTVRISEEAQAECRAILEGETEQAQLQAKKEKTRTARSRAAKSRWANTDVEHSVPGSTVNTAFHVHLEPVASDVEPVASHLEPDACVPGTQCSSLPSLPSLCPSGESSDQPSLRQKLDGWLAIRIASVTKAKTEQGSLPTAREKTALHNLAAQSGHLRVVLGFHAFAGRSQGLNGLDYPISVFVPDAQQWIDLATGDDPESHSHLVDGLIADARALGKDLDPDAAVLLAQLEAAESELTSYEDGAKVVSSYLELLPSSLPQPEPAPAPRPNPVAVPLAVDVAEPYTCYAEFDDGQVWFRRSEAVIMIDDGYLLPCANPVGRCATAPWADLDDIANWCAMKDDPNPEYQGYMVLPRRDRLQLSSAMSPVPPQRSRA